MNKGEGGGGFPMTHRLTIGITEEELSLLFLSRERYTLPPCRPSLWSADMWTRAAGLHAERRSGQICTYCVLLK
jgi:hypothetical protein